MSQKKKTTAQSKRPRKAPSNQTGGTAWGKKAAAAISGKMQSADCASGRCQPTGKAALCVRHCGHASGAGRQNADSLAY